MYNENKDERCISVTSTEENTKTRKDITAANFEEAITATQFGKFNILLMLLAIPPCFSQVFETLALSYVLPVAECDLNLTLEDKGVLNAITFGGMITSGFFWGYLCDALGRRKIMIYGYLFNGLFAILGSFSTNITILMIAKFFSGFIINGPFSAATSYISEFNSSKNRARVLMWNGVTLSVANVILPLLAWGILPRNLDYVLFGYGFHAWNIFLFACALVPLCGALGFAFMPESPKFLMSAGRNDDALKILKKVYRMNTGKHIHTYPIKCLEQERENATKMGVKQALQNGLYQTKPLFQLPYILKILLACSNTLILMMSSSTLKFWLPQLFQSINDYQQAHNGESTNLCEILEDFTPRNISSATCDVNLDNMSVYINSIIVGSTRIVAFLVAGPFVNSLGKKLLLIIMAVTAGCFSSAIYFAQNSETVLALSSLYVGVSSVCENIVVTITLELFPTTLRTMAISLQMLSGRLGIIISNVLFPYLLNAGCAPPFLFIGILAFGGATLSILYPNTENKALK